jgi:hypothetical protein
MPRILLTAVTAALVALASLPLSALACSCGDVPSPGDALEASDGVFLGTVVSVDGQGGEADPVAALAGDKDIAFEVSHRWKGEQARRVVVTTPANPVACGRSFTVGSTYVVYARDNDGDLKDTTCSRTRLQKDAAEDIEVLGAPPERVVQIGAGVPAPFGGDSPADRLRALGPAAASAFTSDRTNPIAAQCDVAVIKDLNGESFRRLVEVTGNDAFICLGDVTIGGDVDVRQAGVRIVASSNARPTIQGNLLSAESIVVAGVHVTGGLLLGERAGGSVLFGNKIDGVAIFVTSNVLLAANEVAGTVRGPGVPMDPALHLPVGAMGLVREVNRADFVGEKQGSWVWVAAAPPRDLSTLSLGLRHFKVDWSKATWPPPAQPRVDLGTDAARPWLPMYGPMGGAKTTALLIPLQARHFQQPDVGFLLTQ